MEEREYDPFQSMSLQKSNVLVSAKYSSTLIENQIMAIALTRIEASARNSGSLTATLYPGELKRLVGDPSNIYKTLKRVSRVMTGHTFFIEDGKGNFRASAIVKDAIYNDGTFKIYLNESIREHILGLEKNFTTYELSVLTDFKKNASFRIYELLKSHIYKSRPDVDGGRVDVVYNLSELRFTIGLADSDDPEVKAAMSHMNKEIDWDLLYKKLEEKDKADRAKGYKAAKYLKYRGWSDFTRFVIDPAQEELKKKSNIRFEYEEGKKKGKRVLEIVFHIYPNTPENEDIIAQKSRIIDENRQLELPRDQFPIFYERYSGHNGLEKEDLDLLLERAGYDEAKVERAIALADQQGHISNYMGWLIKAIEGGYKTTATIDGDSVRAEVVTNVKKEFEDNYDDTAKRVWGRVKTKEDFAEFVRILESKKVTIEQLEDLYDASERTELYYGWKRDGAIRL